MTKVQLLCCLFVLANLVVYNRAREYTTKYDDVDVDSILKSDRLLKNYLNCFLDKGRCTPDAAETKANLHDALETDCEACSEKQRVIGRKVLRYLIQNKREYWDQLQAKYDPENKYIEKYRDRLKSEGIDV